MTKHKREKLSDEDLENALAKLEHWELVDGKLHRRFRFENFIDAFGFMTQLALVAERINHHPEWTNIYNSVSISLSTHDVDGISNLDFDFARAADLYFGD